MTGAEAKEFAERLDLNVHDIPICLACLSFVSMSLGDERKARGWAVRMAPDLWAEGLEQPARLALERARVAGLPGAPGAIANVEARGARGVVVREIVLRLARQLDEKERADLSRMGFQPWRPPASSRFAEGFE
jgi:hypothetical protein